VPFPDPGPHNTKIILGFILYNLRLLKNVLVKTILLNIKINHIVDYEKYLSDISKKISFI